MSIHSSALAKKPAQPLRGALMLLVAVGFFSGLFLLGGVWMFTTGLDMAGSLLGVVLIMLSVTCLLIAFRVYAHIRLKLAQTDQKHVQNTLIQAKDMLDTSKQLREDHILLQSLQQNLPFPVWLKDRFGRYLVTNKVFEKDWCNNVDPKGKTDDDLLTAKLAEAFTAADREALNSKRPQKIEMRFDFSNKDAQWVRIERYPLLNEDSEVVGLIGFALDISAYKNDLVAESELLKDPLTQFMNQHGLSRYMEQTETPESGVHCVHIDIDHFKVINDSLGQESGDDLLRQVSERILLATREGEVLARTSADEFVLFLVDDQDDPVAQRLLDLHEQLNQPIALGDTQYSFTTSFGVAKAPEHGTRLDKLRQNAGVALFNAKKLGRNQIHWYHTDYEDQAMRRLNKEQLLRNAIQEQDLAIHCQPRIDCRSGQIQALECLVRIPLEGGQLMYPGNFIELAEQNGLIRQLDAFMLDQALSQISDWLNQGIDPLPLAINLSLQSFNTTLLDSLNQWQVRHPEVFAYLELELTEHRLPDHDEAFLEHLKNIRDFGIRLALDDFGTGYANLSRLPEWPFQILKLDRSFILDLPTSDKQQAVVKSIIDLCATLDIQVVAEGVETEAELAIVDQLGCQCIQGYVYARPKPLVDASDWLEARRISAQ